MSREGREGRAGEPESSRQENTGFQTFSVCTNEY